MVEFQEEETEIEVIEYTTTTSSKKEVIESKTPIISGQVVELGSRTKQSEVSLQKKKKKSDSAFLSEYIEFLDVSLLFKKEGGTGKKSRINSAAFFFFLVEKSHAYCNLQSFKE